MDFLLPQPWQLNAVRGSPCAADSERLDSIKAYFSVLLDRRCPLSPPIRLAQPFLPLLSRRKVFCLVPGHNSPRVHKGPDSAPQSSVDKERSSVFLKLAGFRRAERKDLAGRLVRWKFGLCHEVGGEMRPALEVDALCPLVR